jgi:hypothetical protein
MIRGSMIKATRKKMIADFRRKWRTGAYDRAADKMQEPSAGQTLDQLCDLAEALEAVQRIYHRRGGATAFTRRDIGGVVDALIRRWPIQGYELKSTKGARATKNIGEHDPPISFFRDLLMDDELRPSSAEWKYILLKYFRVVRISKREDAELRANGWKQNRPSNAYRQCEIHLDTESAVRQMAHRKAANKRIAGLRR